MSLAKEALVAARFSGFMCLTAGMLGAYEAHLACLSGVSRERWQARYQRWWAQTVLGLFGISPKVTGVSAVEVPAGSLVVANHRSSMDIPLLLSLFGGHVLSRADLAQWPLIGRAARSVGTLFVERSDQGSRTAALRQIQNTLEQKRTVIVFSEGGTFGGDEVRPFHTGTFVAVQHLKCPIIPVGLAYPPGTEFVDQSFLSHTQTLGKRTSTPVSVVIGVPVQRAANGKRTAEVARTSVQQLVTQARHNA